MGFDYIKDERMQLKWLALFFLTVVLWEGTQFDVYKDSTGYWHVGYSVIV
jgi:hypothetical protein